MMAFIKGTRTAAPWVLENLLHRGSVPISSQATLCASARHKNWPSRERPMPQPSQRPSDSTTPRIPRMSIFATRGPLSRGIPTCSRQVLPNQCATRRTASLLGLVEAGLAAPDLGDKRLGRLAEAIAGTDLDPVFLVLRQFRDVEPEALTRRLVLSQLRICRR